MQTLSQITESDNVLLTGIPRSGSTLALKLISDKKRVIGFDEPVWLKEVRKLPDAQQVPDNLLKKIQNLRGQVKKGFPVNMNFGKGTLELADNHFDRLNNGLVKTKESRDVILDVSTYDQIWVLKSNIFFTALLKQLIDSGYFKLVVTIRDPLAVIKSWRSLNFSLSHGRSMIAEKYDSSSKIFVDTDDVLIKQVLLLDWMFKKYLDNYKDIHIFKYEDIVNNPSIIQQNLGFGSVKQYTQLNSRNNNHFYDHSETNEIKTCLLKYGQYYKNFYPEVGQ